MAPEEALNNSLAEETDCPVCREDFKDPRSLTCGHHFCRGCLEGILRDSPQRTIKCPTCREETKIAPGSGIKGLQRPYLETLQKKVVSLLSKSKQRLVVQYCDICSDKQTSADHYCYFCRLSLCPGCMDKHQRKTSSHKTVPIDDSLLCKSHPAEIVTLYCKDCSKGVCGHCIFHDHVNHITTNIDTEAKQSRQRLQEYLTAQSGEDKNDILLNKIKEKLVEAKKLQTEFKESVSETRRLLKELEDKVDEVERDTTEKLAAEIKTLTLYESDLNDVIESKQSLAEHASYLTNTASDPELVEREKNFPVSKVRGLQHIEDATVERLVLDKNITNIFSHLQRMVGVFTVAFEEKRLRKARMRDLKKEHKVSISHKIGGLTVDTKRQRFIARTTDSSGPLKVYSYDGQLLETLGAGVSGLDVCGDILGVSMDTKRDLYLAPCSKTLVLVDRVGNQQQSINVGGESNSGVAYDKQTDVYAVSDYVQCTVYLVNPATAQVTRQFGSREQGPARFSQPCKIHVGPVAGICSPCIIVSERGKHIIELFNCSMERVKTYGSSGSGAGQLQYQCDVGIDPEGRVVVCDSYNRRVVTYRTDSAGQDHWECLFTDDWSGNEPNHMALDTENMVLGVTDHPSDSLHIYM